MYKDFVYENPRFDYSELVAIVLILIGLFFLAYPKGDEYYSNFESQTQADILSIVLFLLFFIPAGLLLVFSQGSKRVEVSFDNKKLTYYKNGKKKAQIKLNEVSKIIMRSTPQSGYRKLNPRPYRYLKVISKDEKVLLFIRIPSFLNCIQIREFFLKRLREEGFDEIEVGS